MSIHDFKLKSVTEMLMKSIGHLMELTNTILISLISKSITWVLESWSVRKLNYWKSVFDYTE